MRVWLVSFIVVPVLLVGSGPGAVASTPPAPPHNGLIALSQEGVRLVDPTTGKAWSLPRTSDMANPVWSPDGKLLAANGWDSGGQDAVYTMKPDGSDRRLVLRDASSPSWSPDGKELVVAAGEYGASRLVVVGVDGDDPRELRKTAFIESPAWSPDGRWIAFVEDGEVKLVSPDDTTDVRRVAEEGRNPAWSPDGSKLAFDTTDRNRQYIAVFDLVSGKRTKLEPKGLAYAPAWSPDGTGLAFLAMRPMPTTSHGCGGEMPTDLWTASLDGREPQLLEKDVWGRPSWGTSEPAPPTS